MPDWITIILRTLSLMIVLFFITKWLGKKHLSELNVFEYISGVVLGGVVAIHSSSMNRPLLHGFIILFVWFIAAYVVEYISLKNKAFRDFTQGKSTILIKDGKIMEDNLKKEGYSADDLLENLRKKDIFYVSDVEFAVLEPTGSLSVLPKRENMPPTAKDLGMKLAPKKEPQTVIIDGKVLHEPLANLALNINWLETELEKMNITIENVFLAQADSDGQLTVDIYDDQIVVPSAAEKPLLLASMKKIQADLELFALATENTQSKKMYQKNSEKLQSAIDLVKPYLQ